MIPVVARSIANGSPIIYVALNYRLNGFGFLPGAEVEAQGVGNLGLQDRTSFFSSSSRLVLTSVTERAALRWIKANIAKFGGDPTKITMYVFESRITSTNLTYLSLQLGRIRWSHLRRPSDGRQWTAEQREALPSRILAERSADPDRKD